MTARRDWRQGAAGLVVASFGFPNCACLASANLKKERGNERWPPCKHTANRTSTTNALKGHKLLKLLSITAWSLPFARCAESPRRNLLHKGGGSFDLFARGPAVRSRKAVLTIRAVLPSLSAW